MNDCPEGSQKFIRNDHLPEITDEMEVTFPETNIEAVNVGDSNVPQDEDIDVDDSNVPQDDDNEDDDEATCAEPMSSGTIETMKNLEIEKTVTDVEICQHSEDAVSQRQGNINRQRAQKLNLKRKIMEDPTLLDDLDSGKHFQEDWVEEIRQNNLPLPEDEVKENKDWFNLIFGSSGFFWNCWLCSIMKDFTFFRKSDYTKLAEPEGIMLQLPSENRKLIKSHRNSVLHQRSIEEWKKLKLMSKDPEIKKKMASKNHNPLTKVTKDVKRIVYSGARMNLSFRKQRRMIKMVER